MINKKLSAFFLVLLIITPIFNFTYEVKAFENDKDTKNDNNVQEEISKLGDCVESNPLTGAAGCKTTGCGLCSILNTPYRCSCSIIKGDDGKAYKKCIGVRDETCGRENREWERDCKKAGGNCIPSILLRGIDKSEWSDYGLQKVEGVECKENEGIFEYTCVKSVESKKCGHEEQPCCYNGCKEGLTCCNYRNDGSIDSWGVCRKKCLTSSAAINKAFYDGEKWIVYVQTLDGRIIKMEIKDGKIISSEGENLDNILDEEAQQRLETYFTKKSDIIMKYLYRGDSNEIKEGGPTVKYIKVGDDSSPQPFTLESESDITVKLEGGKPNEEVALSLSLVNIKDKYDEIPIYFNNIQLDEKGNKEVNIKVYFPDGSEQYYLKAEVYDNGELRSLEYWNSRDGTKGIIVLFPLNSLIENIISLTNVKGGNLDERIINYLRARDMVRRKYGVKYENYWEDQDYKESFKKFIEAIINSVEDNEKARNLREALNDDKKLKDLSVFFEREIRKGNIITYLTLSKESIDFTGKLYILALDAINEKKGFWSTLWTTIKIVLFNIIGWFKLVFGGTNKKIDTINEIREEQRKVGSGYSLLLRIARLDENIDKDISSVCDENKLKEIIKAHKKKWNEKEFHIYRETIINGVCKSDFSKELFKAIEEDNAPKVYYQLATYYKDTEESMCKNIYNEEFHKMCLQLYNNAIDLYFLVEELYPESEYNQLAKERLKEIRGVLTRSKLTSVVNSAFTLLLSGGVLSILGTATTGFLVGSGLITNVITAGKVVVTGTGAFFTLIGVMAYEKELAEAEESGASFLTPEYKKKAAKIKTAGSALVNIGIPVVMTTIATISLSAPKVRNTFIKVFERSEVLRKSFDNFVIEKLGLEGTRLGRTLTTNMYEVAFKWGERVGVKVKVTSKGMLEKFTSKAREIQAKSKEKINKLAREVRETKNSKTLLNKIKKKSGLIKSIIEDIEETAKSKDLTLKMKRKGIKALKNKLKEYAGEEIDIMIRKNSRSKDVDINKKVTEVKKSFNKYIDEKYSDEWLRKQHEKVTDSKIKITYKVDKLRITSEEVVGRADHGISESKFSIRTSKIGSVGEDAFLRPIRIKVKGGKSIELLAVGDSVSRDEGGNGALYAVKLLSEKVKNVNWFELDKTQRINVIERILGEANKELINIKSSTPIKSTTLSGAIRVGNELYTFGVGDAQWYVLDNKGRLVDFHVHPSYESLPKNTKIGRGFVLSNPGELLGTTGAREFNPNNIHVKVININGGEKIILASDGLDPVWIDEINKHQVRIKSPKEVATTIEGAVGKANNANVIINGIIKRINFWKSDDIVILAAVFGS